MSEHEVRLHLKTAEELRAEVLRLVTALGTEIATRASAEARIEALFAQIAVLQTGCTCDPPGSGEEFCSGACYAEARAAQAEARAALYRAALACARADGSVIVSAIEDALARTAPRDPPPGGAD